MSTDTRTYLNVPFSVGSGGGGSTTIIYVEGPPATAVADLTDVAIESTPSAGAQLVYDPDTGKWVAKSTQPMVAPSQAVVRSFTHTATNVWLSKFTVEAPFIRSVSVGAWVRLDATKYAATTAKNFVVLGLFRRIAGTAFGQEGFTLNFSIGANAGGAGLIDRVYIGTADSATQYCVRNLSGATRINASTTAFWVGATYAISWPGGMGVLNRASFNVYIKPAGGLLMKAAQNVDGTTTTLPAYSFLEYNQGLYDMTLGGMLKYVNDAANTNGSAYVGTTSEPFAVNAELTEVELNNLAGTSPTDRAGMASIATTYGTKLIAYPNAANMRSFDYIGAAKPA